MLAVYGRHVATGNSQIKTLPGLKQSVLAKSAWVTRNRINNIQSKWKYLMRVEMMAKCCFHTHVVVFIETPFLHNCNAYALGQKLLYTSSQKLPFRNYQKFSDISSLRDLLVTKKLYCLLLSCLHLNITENENRRICT